MPGAVEAPARQTGSRRWLYRVVPLLGAAALVVLAAEVVSVVAGDRSGRGLLGGLLLLAAAALAGATVGRERAARQAARVLYDERGRLVEVEHRLASAVAVDGAVRQINAAVGFETMAATVLGEAIRLLEADDGSVLVIDDEGGLRVAAQVNPDAGAGAPPPGHNLSGPAATIAARVAGRRTPVRLTDPVDAAEFPGMAAGRLSSAVSVPLIAEDQVVGVLSVGVTGPGRRFDPGDEGVLMLLAGHAAIACANARRLTEQADSLVALSEADRRRSDMVAMVTHDLKTPLTSLIGFAQVLSRRGEGLDQRDRARYYAQIERQSSRMLEMVEDLLVSSQAEQGAASFKREPLDLVGVVEEIRGLFADRAPGHRIEVEATPVLDPVYGDRSAVAHVLQNLVDNACKYSEPGTIVRVGVEDQPAQVLLTVADEGAGIPGHELDGIFERFHRVGDAGPRGSVGLGLHVVKSLVAAHGGRVWCESEPGNGSRFSFTLPRRAAPAIAVGSAATTTPPPDH
jgi:signal transduction histidine kinase